MAPSAATKLNRLLNWSDHVRNNCKVKGCTKPLCTRGWCEMHYVRWRRHGSPIAGKTFDGAPKKFLHEKVYTYGGDKCLMWPFSKNPKGYATLDVKGKSIKVSRIVCTRFHGPPPSKKHQAAHSCKKNSGCVNRKHLRWATPSGNQQDRLLHGTHNRGERSARAKLTRKDVRRIRRLISKRTKVDIAKEYGVCAVAIADIQFGRTWSWLQ